MEKFALWTTVFAIGCGLAFGQADSPRPTRPAQPATQPAQPTQSEGAQPATTTPTNSPSTGTTQGTGMTTLANIRSWRGMLMDAKCSGGTEASSPAAASSDTKSDTKPADSDSQEAKSAKPHKNHRNRVDPQVQACSVSSSTTAFALKTKDGQVLKFDDVGNNRAAEELKTKWAQNLSAGKPIHAKVSGMVNGETVTVTSID
ncbi:MAG TPA: hypothetical protein VNH83_05325 [Bryobacteraceae bacterium]|nr:hypothetical protein [Bryobacteraceae bacterium]